MVAEGEVISVEVDEEVREDEEPDQDDAGEDDDQEEVGFVGRALLDLHRKLDARSRDDVEAAGWGPDFWLGGERNLTDDGENWRNLAGTRRQ